MTEHFLIVYRSPRETFTEDATDSESAAVGEHFEYLKKLMADGQLIMAGRTEDATMGLAVLKAENSATAEKIMQNDPVVMAGVFTATLYPYRIALLKSAE